MSILGGIHLTSALVALLLGAIVLRQTPKGTRWHRRLGYTWLATMVVLNVTALMIYRLFGGFGPFHVFALISLASVTVGVLCAIMARTSRLKRDLPRRARWLEAHYQLMSWSYVGLAAAAVSETATRLPATRPRPGQELMFGLAVAVATIVVMTIGGWWTRSRRNAQLIAVGVRMDRRVHAP